MMNIEIIEDEIIEDEIIEDEIIATKNKKVVNKKVVNKKVVNKKPANILHKFYDIDPDVFEIGVDEAGRGPLFGRVYSGAVILPKDDTFDHSQMKDSKKFHSKTKIAEVAEYIKANAIAWGVGYESEQVIDNINILQATQQSMHKAISNACSHAISKTTSKTISKNFSTSKAISESSNSTNEKMRIRYQLLVDGNYFKPYLLDTKKVPYVTVEGGDNKYSSIAAASILAKVARDKYIDDMCDQYPYLSENYGINSNKGYGAKRHIDGIKEHGITVWHRRSFGICKNY
jgi:ribonuclease HII